MGKSILYCGDCGKVLKEEDFERLRAGYLQNSPYCIQCCPNVVLSTPPAPKEAAPSRSTTTRVRVLPSSTPGRTLRSSSSGSLPPILAAVGGALLVVVIVAVLSSSRKPAPERAPAPVARVEEPAPKPEPEPPPPPPRPRPAPVRPAEPEPPPRPAEAPSAVLDRYLGDIQAIRDKDTSFRRADEIRSMLRRAAEIAGPRKAEVVALLADYEKAIAVPAPAEAPKPAPAPAPPPPDARIVDFTLIDADTEKPVPGFDPMAPDAVIDLGKLGLKKIDVRVNTAPRNVNAMETIIDSAKVHTESGPPYSFTSNSQAAGFTGWTPSAGRHTLKCRIGKGAWVTINFTVVDPR